MAVSIDGLHEQLHVRDVPHNTLCFFCVYFKDFKIVNERVTYDGLVFHNFLDLKKDLVNKARIKILTIGSIFPKVGACSRSIGLIPVIHSL